MKKFKGLSAVLAVILTVSLTACGDSPSDESGSMPEIDKSEPVTVTVWHYYNGVQQVNFDNAVAEFNRTVGYDEGIIVEAVSKGSISELADSIVASVKKSAGAENPPDIFATYAETAYTLDQMGALADIGKYFSEDEIGEYVDAYIDEGRFSGDGSIKIFPTAKSTEIMILNSTDWEAFAEAENITTDDLKTWESVTEVAEKYYNYTDSLTPDIENDGRAFFGRDSVANYMIVGAKQLGAEFSTLDDSGKPVLNIDKTAVKKLWDNYYVPYVKGCYTMQGRYRSDDVKLGKSIAIICSTTGTAYYPTEVTINDDYTYPIDNIILPLPDFEGTDSYAVQQGAGMSVISSDEQTEYASAVFLKWFTEEERNIEFSINSGYLPVKKSANNVDKIDEVNSKSENAVKDTMLNSLELAIDEVNSRSLYTMKPFETASEVRDYLGNYIQDTADEAYAEVLEKISGGMSRDEAVAEFISDSAFDEWFDEFSSSLENMVR
ncbi:MAG: extracellular solute-binding protein [Ruminococcus flavefaciens]|nr:extracellular solute-binding protein [Ruminococcus flavefaciens]MCM1231051.1 extracellular solute-binding protein [Ruminococcus flavefaciens]